MRPRRRTLVAALVALIALVAVALVARPGYPLDSVSRGAATTGRLRCPRVALVTYRGEIIRYHRPLRVYRGFVPRLRRFEALVRDTAIEVYGRPPRKIVHLGAYCCRRIRGYPSLLSEHALGNALDVAGFDFGPARRGAARRAFSVRLAQHWSGRSRQHRTFLRRLDRRVRAANDLFTVVLGPGARGHSDHFHLDRGPSAWRKALDAAPGLVGALWR